MKTYRGGEKVEPGLAMLVVGPVIGLAYVMFLPLIGVGMALSLLGLKVARAAAGPAEALVRAIRPGWEPALAFLSRARGAKKAAGPTADVWAEGVREKLEAPESPGEPEA